MAIFYIAFEVRPTKGNTHFEEIEGAIAHCWVLEESAPAAYNKAWFFVYRDEWDVTNSSAPLEVVEEDFLDQDLGRERFAKAKHQSLAIYYTAWPRNGHTAVEPTVIKRSNGWDLNRFVRGQSKARARGRCLHVNSNGQCKAIDAHSIQENGLLREISKDGHVYVPWSDIGTLRKNGGKVTVERRGIRKVSTFRGFCAQHDSELFKPIDNAPLYPTDQQVTLYAYRSVCRELFVKENALSVATEQLAQGSEDRGALMLLRSFRRGTSFGLEQLRRHKALFDEALRRQCYTDVEYTLFTCRHRPVLAFSGLVYPEFDFMGRKLQNLADCSSQLDLLTMCAANMQNGWGFLFAWHKASSAACREFLRSLATVVHQGRSAGESLFPMVVATCENLAIAPEWWESLAESQREKVCSGLGLGSNLFAPPRPENLVTRLEDIADWDFDGVVQNGRSS